MKREGGGGSGQSEEHFGALRKTRGQGQIHDNITELLN